MLAQLRQAFGSDAVHKVPAGLAVGTDLTAPDGDRIGFYVVPTKDGRSRIEDDGATAGLLPHPPLALMRAYGVRQRNYEFFLGPVSATNVVAAGRRFAEFLLAVKSR